MLQETGTVLGQTKNSEQVIGEQISVQGSFTTGKTKIIWKALIYNLIVLHNPPQHMAAAIFF
jgi:hypothetical protein